MHNTVADLHTAIRAVTAIDTDALADLDTFRQLAIDTQHALDALRVAHAHIIANADAAGVWTGTGQRSMSAWLANTTHGSHGDTRRSLKLAAVLNHGAVADAVARGDLSPAAAEALLPAITATADHTDISELVDACNGASVRDTRDAGTKWIELNPKPGTTPEEHNEHRRNQRSLKFRDRGDGTTDITGTLPAWEARIIQRALQHIIGAPTPGDDRTHEQKLVDALVSLCQAYSRGDVKGGRHTPTILVTIDLDTLQGLGPGVGYTADGDIIPADIIRHLVPNANLQRVLTADSVPVDVGREKRFATDHQYRALVARDGGCRMTDCNAPPGWCDIDHINQWEHGGHTNLDDLVLWCRYHHLFRHRPDVHLTGNANNLTMHLPNGTVLSLPARGPITKAA